MTTDKVKRAGNRSTKRRPAVRVFLGGAKARGDAVSRADGQFATHPAPFTNDHWRAWVLSNYDGDTMTVCYDAGFFDTGTRDVRLFGINAPELKTGSKRSRAKGQKAKALLAAMCPSGTPIAMVTSLDPNLDDPTEKYGRILAQIVKYNPDGSTTDVNAAMLASGLVVSYLPGKAKQAGTRLGVDLPDARSHPMCRCAPEKTIAEVEAEQRKATVATARRIRTAGAKRKR